MAVSLIVSPTINGSGYSDALSGGDFGIDMGQVSNGSFSPLVNQTTNEGFLPLFLRHDAVIDPITGAGVFAQQYTGTYGGAETAAEDFTRLQNMGFASAGSTANNSNGDWQGLAFDMDYDVTQAVQFNPSRIGSGGGAGSNVYIIGDGTLSPSEGIDLSSSFILKAAAMCLNDAGTPVAPTTPEDGKIGKSADTILGDRCYLRGRFYLNSAAVDGGIMQFDTVFNYSHTA